MDLLTKCILEKQALEKERDHWKKLYEGEHECCTGALNDKDAIEIEVARRQGELVAVMAQAAEYTQDNRALRSTLSNYREQMRDMDERNKRLTCERDGARFTYANLDTVREQRDKYWKEMQALNAQVADLKAQMRDMEERCHRLTREREEARAKNTELNKTMLKQTGWVRAVQAKSGEFQGKCVIRIVGPRTEYVFSEGVTAFYELLKEIAKGPDHSDKEET
jgi:hypothetical protein